MIKENRLCGLGTIQPILNYCALHELWNRREMLGMIFLVIRDCFAGQKLLTSMFSTCLESTAMLFTSHFLLLLLSNFNEFVEASPIFLKFATSNLLSTPLHLRWYKGKPR